MPAPFATNRQRVSGQDSETRVGRLPESRKGMCPVKSEVGPAFGDCNVGFPWALRDAWRGIDDWPSACSPWSLARFSASALPSSHWLPSPRFKETACWVTQSQALAVASIALDSLWGCWWSLDSYSSGEHGWGALPFAVATAFRGYPSPPASILPSNSSSDEV